MVTGMRDGPHTEPGGCECRLESWWIGTCYIRYAEVAFLIRGAPYNVAQIHPASGGFYNVG